MFRLAGLADVEAEETHCGASDTTSASPSGDGIRASRPPNIEVSQSGRAISDAGRPATSRTPRCSPSPSATWTRSATRHRAPRHDAEPQRVRTRYATSGDISLDVARSGSDEDWSTRAPCAIWQRPSAMRGTCTSAPDALAVRGATWEPAAPLAGQGSESTFGQVPLRPALADALRPFPEPKAPEEAGRRRLRLPEAHDARDPRVGHGHAVPATG